MKEIEWWTKLLYFYSRSEIMSNVVPLDVVTTIYILQWKLSRYVCTLECKLHVSINTNIFKKKTKKKLCFVQFNYNVWIMSFKGSSIMWLISTGPTVRVHTAGLEVLCFSLRCGWRTSRGRLTCLSQLRVCRSTWQLVSVTGVPFDLTEPGMSVPSVHLKRGKERIHI